MESIEHSIIILQKFSTLPTVQTWISLKIHIDMTN